MYTNKYNGPASARRGRSRAWAARPRWRLNRGEEIALGPGKADLLEAVERVGAISLAARELGMSYRRAWLLVETMNRCFARPLVSTETWRGSGSALTPEGRRVLSLYRELETRSLTAAAPCLAQLKALLTGSRQPQRAKARSRKRPSRKR
ncbi:MAG TPA: LysR family transcriptional regulator [Candidatus Polarisedimenticolia bacterium]|nr:LysR family transcriptional regulator [Candidatus Polarisedimenticolia bacterium]